MKENSQIKKLEGEDVYSALSVVLTSFEPLFLLPSIYNSKGIAKFLESELKNPFSYYDYYIIKNQEEGIVGYCEFKRLDEGVFLNLIATNKNAKEKGNGNSMLTNSMQHYKRKGFKQILLDVFSKNKIALSWYSRLGFKIGKETFFYKVKNVLLSEVSILHNLYVLNYPQHIALTSAFGFSMIDVNLDEKHFRFGVINNNLFYRGAFTEDTINIMTSLKCQLNLNDTFIIAEQMINEEGVELLDTIYRMNLNLQNLPN